MQFKRCLECVLLLRVALRSLTGVGLRGTCASSTPYTSLAIPRATYATLQA